MQPYMAIAALAKHFSVSISTVRNWVRSGQIPPDTYVKVSTTYRFNVAKVEEALLASTTRDADSQKQIAAAGTELNQLAEDDDEDLHSILDDYEEDL